MSRVAELYYKPPLLGTAIDPQRTPGGHRLDGIGAQVPEDLLDLVGIAVEIQSGRAADVLDVVSVAHLRAVLEEENRLLKQRGDLEHFRRKAARAGVLQKVGDDPVESMRFAQDDVHEVTLRGRQRQLVLEHLDRTHHRGQRIADLVGDGGGEIADRRHFPLHLQLILQPLDVGEILKDEHISFHAAADHEWRDGQADVHGTGADRQPFLAADRSEVLSGVVDFSLDIRGEIEHREGVLAEDILDGAAEQGQPHLVDLDNQKRTVGGEQSAAEAGQDGFVVLLEILQPPRLLLHFQPGHAQPLGEQTDEEPHQGEAHQVDFGGQDKRLDGFPQLDNRVEDEEVDELDTQETEAAEDGDHADPGEPQE